MALKHNAATVALMAKTTDEKKADFGRIFCPRVEKLQKQLDLLANCSNRSNYAWTNELIERTWFEIAKTLRDSAHRFGVDFHVTVNGVSVAAIDTSKPRKPKAQPALF